MSRDGDGCIGSNGADAEGDDDADDSAKDTTTAPLTEQTLTDKTKKKRRRPKKKKTKVGAPTQSSPPRVSLHELFPKEDYPVGQLLDHAAPFDTTSRAKAQEARFGMPSDIEDSSVLKDYRKAAEAHRQVRKWVQETARPGQSLTDLAVGIDDGVRALVGEPGLEPGSSLRAGLGFPTGLSLNDCVAHYTPNPGYKPIILQQKDVMKVDFGVHVNGWIVDSAFTMSFDPTYDNLLAAVKAATNAGIAAAGIDVHVCDVSAEIQEVMESHEVEIGGNVYPVKAVRGLCGHNIKRYRIHGDKTIPFTRNNDETRMDEGDVFAIETFGTTGRGRLRDGDGVYGYGLSEDAPARVSLPLASANRVYKTIKQNFGNIVFCRRYLERLGVERYLAGINSLVANGVLETYPPLMDIPGSYSAQFEHTVLLRGSQKEVISRGDDY